MRAHLRSILVVGLLPLLAMCTGAPEPESRRVAERFMELYYGQSNVAEAVKLSTGAAKAKLEGELAAVQGMAPVAPADKPHVGFRLTSKSAAGAGQATFAYDVDARTSGDSLTATLVLSGDGGHWLVTTFVENEKAS